MKTTIVKYINIKGEWLVYKTLELKQWEKSNFKAFQFKDGVDNVIQDQILISDHCLFQLAKKGDKLDKNIKLLIFLILQPDLAEFSDKKFKYFC